MENNDKNEILEKVGELSGTVGDLTETVGDLTEKVDTVLEAIGNFSNKVDQRFDGIDRRFDGLEQRLTKVEATMVTKDYLDDKLADLRGDLTVLMRKEDTKLNALVEIMKDKKLLNEEEAQKVLSMVPFARPSN